MKYISTRPLLACALICALAMPFPALAQNAPDTATLAPSQNAPALPDSGMGKAAGSDANGGNNQRRGRRRRQLPVTPPVEFVPGGTISSAPILGKNGLLYLTSWNNLIYALDAQTGLRRWRFIAPKMFNASPALGPDGTLYACCYDGKVYALDGETGQEKWEYATRSLLNTTPAVSAKGDMVFVGGYDHSLYAIDTRRGKLKWRNVLGSIASSPVIGKDGTVYVGADKIYAFNPATGLAKWEYLTGFDAQSPVAVDPNGIVYAHAHDETGRSQVVALDSRNGKPIWVFPLTERVAYSPAVEGENVYVSADQVYCVRGQTGRPLWQYGEGSARWSSVVVNGKLVCVANGDSTLVALDRLNGDVLWTFPTNDPLLSFPVFGPDGTIYIACEGDSKVYALSSNKGEIVWSFQEDPLPPPPPATAPPLTRTRKQRPA